MNSPRFRISLARQGRLHLVLLLLAANAMCIAAPLASAGDDDDRDDRPSARTLALDPLPAVTRAAELLLQGRAKPGQHVRISGGAASVSGRADKAGRFQIAVPLVANRENPLEVSTDAHHHHHQRHHGHHHHDVVRVRIVQDSMPPVLTIQQPADATVYDSAVHLVGTATDPAGSVASVSCGPVAAQLAVTQFSCDVPLQPGPNTIRVWAVDAAGNVAAIERVIIRALSELPGGLQRIAARLVDLDGDGNVDLVTAELATGIVGIRFGRPDGTWQPERRLPLAAHPSAIDVADFDGDGLQDLLIAEYEAGEVAVWLGRPDGTFVAGPRLSTAALPSAVLAADVNGDGRMDVVTAHIGGEVHVHMARAGGGFDMQPAIKAGAAPVALTVASLGGDGHLELLAANYISNDVSLFPLDASGRPGAGQRIALGGSHAPLAIATGDFDDDGVLDIVTGNFDTGDVTLLRGVGQGQFAAPKSIAAGLQPVALTTIDLTGDRRPDVLVTSQDGAQAQIIIALHGEVPTVAQPLSQLPLLTLPATLRPHVDPPAISAPTREALRIAVDMPSPFGAPTRRPAANLPPPLSRIGQTFGSATSNYSQLLGPNGASYPPLSISQRAGAAWVRLEADPGLFGPGNVTDFDRMSATVDAFLAKGLSVHFVVSDWLYAPKWDPALTADFPNDKFMTDLTGFATKLANATNRPGGRVIYEIWNEPNLLGYFWPNRTGVDEAAAYAKLLTAVTEAIHAAAPGSVVLAGGIYAYGDDYMQRFLAKYQSARAGYPRGLVDRFALHPYPYYSQDIFHQFRHDLDQAGFVGSPIQITEIGGWDVDRAAVASWNAGILLRAIEEDVQYINLWSALSAPTSTGQQLGGFMDLANRTDGCMASAYAPLPNVNGYVCHPSTYALSTFRRVAEGRTYAGALFDSRPFGLPGTIFGDQLSGVHALKFESAEDVVIAVFSADRYRPNVPGSGRVYSVRFPQQPLFVIGHTGSINDPTTLSDADGRYSISLDRGPLYFLFSKSGTPPVHNITARVLCANGSAPLRGDVQISDTVFPPAPPAGNLVFTNDGLTSAGAPVVFSRALPQFFSSVYVAAEVADGSGRVLPLRSGAKTGGGPGAPRVIGGLFFNPPTPMAQIGPVSSGAGTYLLDFLAPPEWCVP